MTRKSQTTYVEVIYLVTYKQITNKLALTTKIHIKICNHLFLYYAGHLINTKIKNCNESSYLHIHAVIPVPHSLTDPRTTQKMAITATRSGKKKNPLFLHELFAVSESLPAEVFVFMTFILILLKLGIRPKA